MLVYNAIYLFCELMSWGFFILGLTLHALLLGLRNPGARLVNWKGQRPVDAIFWSGDLTEQGQRVRQISVWCYITFASLFFAVFLATWIRRLILP